MCEKYLLPEECYESKDESLDDLLFEDLIKEAEFSKLLWKRVNINEFPQDVTCLKKQLDHSEKQLDFVSRIGSQLLVKINKLTDENESLTNQIQFMSDEIVQMKYEDVHRHNRYFTESDCLDASETFSEAYDIDDDKFLDVKSSCSSELQSQLAHSELSNRCMEEELRQLQRKMEDEVAMVRNDADDHIAGFRKTVKCLEERLETKQLELARCQSKHEECIKIVNSLLTNIKQLEIEVDQFSRIIEENEKEKSFNQKQISDLSSEKDQLTQLNSELRQQLHDLRTTNQPRVLRHVTNSCSPYVQSDAFSQEIDINSSRTNSQPLSFFLSHQSKLEKPTSKPYFEYKTSIPWARNVHSSKLGVPGRLGSRDLDFALNRLQPTMHQSNIDLSQTPRQVQYNKPFTELHTKEPKVSKFRSHQITNSLSSLSHSCHNLTKLQPTNHSLLTQWRNLCTPTLNKLLQTQLGVWVKGSHNNNVFIEENFSEPEPFFEHLSSPKSGSGGVKGAKGVLRNDISFFDEFSLEERTQDVLGNGIAR